ncbi:MAG: glycosyltransferase [Bacteroidia bacterium]|nr:glycosyltransferase [Bacteroidia bacterium]
MYRFSLIVCTYMRSRALLNLLETVEKQTLYPDEILVIDASENTETELMLQNNSFKQLRYYKVEKKHKGLTKQRNFGIQEVAENIDVVCFLDDDILLNTTYFEELINTYKIKSDALAVGGYITNEVQWEKTHDADTPKRNEFYIDGYKRKDSQRFVIRKYLGLQPNVPPGYSPAFSHARSIGFLPPSGKIYPVELFMGGVSSYRKEVFQNIQFSEYLMGYGLYEDADFCLRLSKTGKLYVNTAAQCEHHHEASGRPNYYKYGKMVVENGWYIWRTKCPHPDLKIKMKWHSITLLLIIIRFTNTLTASNKKAAFQETLGRVSGWFNVLFNKIDKT